MPIYKDHYRPDIKRLTEQEQDLSFNLKNLIEVYSDKAISKIECYRWAADFLRQLKDAIISDLNETATIKGLNEIDSIPDVVIQNIGKDVKRILNGVERGKLSKDERGLMADTVADWVVHKIQRCSIVELARINKFTKVSITTDEINVDIEDVRMFYINDKLPALPFNAGSKNYFAIPGGQ